MALVSTLTLMAFVGLVGYGSIGGNGGGVGVITGGNGGNGGGVVVSTGIGGISFRHRNHPSLCQFSALIDFDFDETFLMPGKLFSEEKWRD